MDRNITPMNGGEQVSFKDTLILNLQRNKEICKQNITVFEEKISMCDELVDLLNREDAAAEFAEKMQKLQAGIPQNG